MSRLYLFLVALGLWLSAPTPVTAAGAEFTVTPDTAGSSATSYWQYQLKANTTQSLNVTLKNEADHARKFDLSFQNAGVASNGQLFYTPGAKLTQDDGPSLAGMLSEPKRTVTVSAHSQQIITTALKVPDTTWAGERLGSLYVQAQADDATSGIQNRFAMAIPLHLTINHALTNKPELTLSKPKLQRHAQTATVTASLANHTARLFGHITQTARLIGPNGKSLATQTLHNAQMPPNGIMPIQLPIKKSLTPGRYTLDVTLDSGTQHYHFTKTFTIAANAIAATKSMPIKAAIPWWVYALIASLIAVIGWLLWTRKRS